MEAKGQGSPIGGSSCEEPRIYLLDVTAEIDAQSESPHRQRTTAENVSAQEQSETPENEGESSATAPEPKKDEDVYMHVNAPAQPSQNHVDHQPSSRSPAKTAKWGGKPGRHPVERLPESRYRAQSQPQKRRRRQQSDSKRGAHLCQQSRRRKNPLCANR